MVVVVVVVVEQKEQQFSGGGNSERRGEEEEEEEEVPLGEERLRVAHCSRPALLIQAADCARELASEGHRWLAGWLAGWSAGRLVQVCIGSQTTRSNWTPRRAPKSACLLINRSATLAGGQFAHLLVHSLARSLDRSALGRDALTRSLRLAALGVGAKRLRQRHSSGLTSAVGAPSRLLLAAYTFCVRSSLGWRRARAPVRVLRALVGPAQASPAARQPLRADLLRR